MKLKGKYCDGLDGLKYYLPEPSVRQFEKDWSKITSQIVHCHSCRNPIKYCSMYLKNGNRYHIKCFEENNEF